MADTAFDDLVRVFAREFPGIRTCLQMRSAVGVTFKGDGRHAVMTGAVAKPLFEIGKLRLALGEPSRQR